MTPDNMNPELQELVEAARRLLGVYKRTTGGDVFTVQLEQAIEAAVSNPTQYDEKEKT